MVRQLKLSPAAAKVIDSKVDDLFDRLLVRLLGHAFTDKRLYIGWHYDFSLPGIFHAATQGEGGRVDTDILTGIADIARDFIEKHRAQAKAVTKHKAQELLQQLHSGKIEHDEFRNHLDSEFHQLWDKIRSGVERVVETENEHAKTAGIRDGLIQINASLGIEDPQVVFIPVKDHALCDECRRLHLLPDGVTPRVWYSSEVEAGYHKKGVDRPSWNLLHPHCRCSLSTVLKGFGFDANGRVTWIGEQHDELAYQRSYKRVPRGEEPRRKKLGKSEANDDFPDMTQDNNRPIWWHGTPSGDLRGGSSGLHVGTRLAAQQALHARIGYPAEGSWDGTREYGKTKLAGAKTIAARGLERTGANATVPEEDYFPTTMPKFSDGTQMSPTHKPDIFPLRIVGPMTNTTRTPHPDFRANGMMAGLLKRKAAKRGFYYYNVGEDAGSISATVPGPSHIERIPLSEVAGRAQYWKKSEAPVEIPLLKFDVKYADLSRELKRYGWQEEVGGSHILWKHPGIPGRPVPVKHDHASGSKPIDDDMLRNKYLRQAGLSINRAGDIVPSAKHPYAEHYANLGFEVPGLQQKFVPKTWTPQEMPPGVQSVPIEHLDQGPFEEWQAAMHTAKFNLGKGHQVPHVTAMDLGDGKLTVDRGSEIVEAARRAGMTHVPVLMAKN